MDEHKLMGYQVAQDAYIVATENFIQNLTDLENQERKLTQAIKEDFKELEKRVDDLVRFLTQA